MITPDAASFVAARPDFHHLQRIGIGTTWSTKTLSGTVTEYVAFNHPRTRYEGGVKEAVVHFHTDTPAHLTARVAAEVAQACRPRHDRPCHYVLDADGYGDAFAEAVEQAAGPEATVTLIDRSIMEAWNADRAALHRLAAAEHALNDGRASDLFLYEIGEPEDVATVSTHFANVLYSLCGMVVDFNHDVDLAEGVKESWAAAASDYHRGGQVRMALAALDIAVGAIEGVFPDLGVDREVTERALRALAAAADAIDPEHHQ